MTQKIDISISRDCGFLMRGMAIVMIALHNFCHLIPTVVPENEFRFFVGRIMRFQMPRDTFTAQFFDVLSFLGWYGVPVFMFLTGYGLVMKYEHGKAPLSAGRFVANNYLKLFFLMLPSVAAFIICSLAITLPYGKFGFHGLLDYTCQLTMLPDIVYPLWHPNPGIFWYFGLTMEFYIIYAFFIHGKRSWWMWALVALSLALQLTTNPTGIKMEWIRHNATGWMAVLAFGIIYGRNTSINRWIAFATVAIALLLIWPSMLDSSSWHFSILACVVIAIAVAKISMLIPGWRGFWICIGRLSPIIFAAHPVARFITYVLFSPKGPSMLQLVVYIGITLALTLLFRPVVNFCYRRFLPSFQK